MQFDFVTSEEIVYHSPIDLPIEDWEEVQQVCLKERIILLKNGDVIPFTLTKDGKEEPIELGLSVFDGDSNELLTLNLHTYVKKEKPVC